MTGSDAHTVFYVAFWLAIVGAVARSVWLISWKYLVGLYGALALNIVLFSAYMDDDEIEGYFAVGFAHFFLAYLFCYKFVMREEFLKPVIPALLIEKSRHEDLPFGWIFLYMPHVLFVVMIVWIFVKFVIPMFA